MGGVLALAALAVESCAKHRTIRYSAACTRTLTATLAIPMAAPQAQLCPRVPVPTNTKNAASIVVTARIVRSVKRGNMSCADVDRQMYRGEPFQMRGSDLRSGQVQSAFSPHPRRWTLHLFSQSRLFTQGIGNRPSIAGNPLGAANREKLPRSLFADSARQYCRRRCESALAAACRTANWAYSMGGANCVHDGGR